MHLVAEALDLEQPAVCGKADFAGLGQISQAFADTEIIGVVDAQVVGPRADKEFFRVSGPSAICSYVSGLPS